MTTTRQKHMLTGMVESYQKNGHITTTTAKAKALKPILQSKFNEDAVYSVRVGYRKGDNAQLTMLTSRNYVTKKFADNKTKLKTKSNAKAN